MRCRRTARVPSVVRWANAGATPMSAASARSVEATAIDVRRRVFEELMMALILLLLLAGSIVLGQPEPPPAPRAIGEIEFFGYKGLDVERVRAALPFHEGDMFPPAGPASSDELKDRIRRAVRGVLGRDATDVS